MAAGCAVRTVRAMTAPSLTALVTGASRGLGLALSRSLAADGWALVVDARQPDALAAAVDSLPRGARVVPVRGDIADPLHRDDLAVAATAVGGLDLVVLNAGTLGPSPLRPLADVSLDELRRTLETNVVAQLGVVQAVLPHLRPGAAIVAISSDAAAEPYEGWGAYGASKAALEQLAAILAIERPDLRVLRIDPGDMRTQMHQDAYPGEDISDRPPPEDSVPGIRHVIEGALPSGRYRVTELPAPLGMS